MITLARDKELLHVKEAAAEIGQHPNTLRRRIHAGDLAAVRLGPGGRYRIRREDLEKFIVPATEGETP